MKGLIILIILLWVPFHMASAEKYMDCKKATLAVEKKICASYDLMRLDFSLNVQYKNVLKGINNDPELIRSQKAWLNERNQCVDESCLEKVYQARIYDLENTYFQPRLPVVETARRDESVSLEDIAIKMPYPDVWGYLLPNGVDTETAIPNAKGEVLFPIYWVNKYGALKPHKKSYVGFFSGLQVEIDKETERKMLRKHDDPILGKYSPECPLPTQNKELYELSFLCYIRFEHALQNKNIIRYINVVGDLHANDYDFNERYFQYLGLYDANGRLLKRVTPILLAKQHGISDICGEYLGSHVVNTKTRGLGDPVWLEDDSFIVSIGDSFVLRIDKNLQSKWPLMNKKGLYLVDTDQLEKLGHVHKTPKKSCLKNELDTDAAVASFLQHLIR